MHAHNACISQHLVVASLAHRNRTPCNVSAVERFPDRILRQIIHFGFAKAHQAFAADFWRLSDSAADRHSFSSGVGATERVRARVLAASLAAVAAATLAAAAAAVATAVTAAVAAAVGAATLDAVAAAVAAATVAAVATAGLAAVAAAVSAAGECY
jgi:hypothetical protein